jgi:hypothetical protein
MKRRMRVMAAEITRSSIDNIVVRCENESGIGVLAFEVSRSEYAQCMPGAVLEISIEPVVENAIWRKP